MFGTQLTVLSSPVHLRNSTVGPAAPEIPDCEGSLTPHPELQRMQGLLAQLGLWTTLLQNMTVDSDWYYWLLHEIRSPSDRCRGCPPRTRDVLALWGDTPRGLSGTSHRSTQKTCSSTSLSFEQGALAGCTELVWKDLEAAPCPVCSPGYASVDVQRPTVSPSGTVLPAREASPASEGASSMCIERLLVPDTLRDTDVSVRFWVTKSRNDFGITLPKREGTDWRDGQQLTELPKGLESGGGKAGRMEETGGQAAGGTVSRAHTPLLRVPRKKRKRGALPADEKKSLDPAVLRHRREPGGFPSGSLLPPLLGVSGARGARSPPAAGSQAQQWRVTGRHNVEVVGAGCHDNTAAASLPELQEQGVGQKLDLHSGVTDTLTFTARIVPTHQGGAQSSMASTARGAVNRAGRYRAFLARLGCGP
ncbi:unnamed protein product [Rangifer tarandus platyrhynchus]|uniref:Uncharacterized protein n=2 Tax=Rangifer tarandus platyrhynchus TaxID=3082113 RepID=A0ACB0F631_RANTA|nr:unnamed protein product [Rangifer tarandus platyrhynchus]CAI9708298.1 unnamed protein product [Rangifer tarandus platyrhynchus]